MREEGAKAETVDRRTCVAEYLQGIDFDESFICRALIPIREPFVASAEIGIEWNFSDNGLHGVLRE